MRDCEQTSRSMCRIAWLPADRQASMRADRRINVPDCLASRWPASQHAGRQRGLQACLPACGRLSKPLGVGQDGRQGRGLDRIRRHGPRITTIPLHLNSRPLKMSGLVVVRTMATCFDSPGKARRMRRTLTRGPAGQGRNTACSATLSIPHRRSSCRCRERAGPRQNHRPDGLLGPGGVGLAFVHAWIDPLDLALRET